MCSLFSDSKETSMSGAEGARGSLEGIKIRLMIQNSCIML